MIQKKLLICMATGIVALLGFRDASAQTQLNVWRNDGNALLAKFANYAWFGDRTALLDIQNGNGVLWRYGVGGTGNGLGLNNGQFYIEKWGGGAKFVIDGSGNVGIGSNVPGSYKTKIVHGIYGLNLENSSNGHDWELWTGSGTGNLYLYFNGSQRGSFNSATGAYSSVSDERQKTNIKAMPTVLEKVNQLKPTTYQFRNAAAAGANEPEAYGFLAQDVEKVFPHLVTHTTDKDRGEDTYTMDYSGFGVIAIKAIQELQKDMQAMQKAMQEQGQQLEKQVQQNAVLQQEVNELKAAAGKSTNAVNTKTILSSAQLGMVSANPVVSSASISYSIPQGSNKAQLVINDASGRTIKRLQLAGSGTVQVDASTLSSGVYTYSLVIDDKMIETRKMIVTK